MTARITGRVAAAAKRMRRAVERWSLPRFATDAPGFEMRTPRNVVNGDRIHVGHDVKLGPNSELKATTRFPGGWMRHPEGKHVEQTFEPTIRIGDRVTATAALQVAAFREIIIEDDVMFAANVFLCDGLHGFDNGEEPYKYQGITRVAPIRIGRGAWIGQNVVVMPGVHIGALAIIGANSVVTRDVPARAIASGVPARVRRRWDATAGAWRDVDPSAP